MVVSEVAVGGEFRPRAFRMPESKELNRENDFHALDESFANMNFVYVEGPNGCGKTTTVQRYLAKRKRKGVYISLRAKSMATVLHEGFGSFDCATIHAALREMAADRRPDEKPPVVLVDDVDAGFAQDRAETHKLLAELMTWPDSQLVDVVVVSSESIEREIHKRMSEEVALSVRCF